MNMKTNPADKIERWSIERLVSYARSIVSITDGDRYGR